jgi:hypothetical protein
MATHTIPEGLPEDAAEPITETAVDNDDNFSFSSPAEDKPKTGQELYRALVENGFIGGWKDRTDIGDSLEYARLLRKRASERLRSQ